ncbi:MAG TPA: DUF3995 domain-containing protein [Alphaproteobacteria bacterium]|nr:DUF3995 domain-containing protein [Alphaproteobacteria bacterium]
MTVAAMIVAALVFVALLTMALAHLMWATGSTWPIRDPALLARTVVGKPGLERVPRLRALVVAIIALGSGVYALALADPLAGGPAFTAFGALLAVLFLARGALGYTGNWRARRSEEPYASLNRNNYSPLNLAIGVGFAVLVLLRTL